MKRNNGLRAVVAIAALAGMTSACSSEQPVPYCQVNNNAFLVKMQRTGGTGACTTVPGDQFVDDPIEIGLLVDPPMRPDPRLVRGGQRSILGDTRSLTRRR